MTGVPPADSHDPFNTKRPVVYDLQGIQRWIFYPVAAVLWLYLRTLRFRFEPGTKAAIGATRPPRLIVGWHNRSLVAPAALPKLFRPGNVACLISPSKLAAWEATFFHFLGFKVIRGSTTRRSIQAGIELLRAIRAGDDAGLTPDGPSGPLYQFQTGAVALSRKAGVPLVILVGNCRTAIRLKTWDRHLVPLPFARISVRARVVNPDDPVWKQSDEAVAENLRRVCLELTEDPVIVTDHD